MRLVIRPAAAADVEAAYLWYLEQDPEVATELYPVLHRGTRR